MGEYMGTSLDLGVSVVHCTMRAVVLVLLGAVAINAEAEADPLLVHHTGVGHTVAGVYNAHIPGVHHGHSVAPVAPVVHAGVKHVAGVYSHPFHYNYMYGKREAEAEPEAEADPVMYTNGVVHHTGINHVAGVYNAHVPAVHAGVTHVAGVHPVHTVAPAVNHVAGVYSHPYNFLYGKREAEAEAEADPLMYHHTRVAHVGGVHPVHTSVYNHHVVPAVHHGVNHVAGVYSAPVSTVNHVAGVHHVGVGHVAGVHPVHNVVRGVYNTYPYLG